MAQRKTAEVVIREITSQMSDGNDYWKICGIVEKSQVKGQWQENTFFGHEYCHQVSRGISGDEFYGHMYFPLPGGKYVMVEYSC